MGRSNILYLLPFSPPDYLNGSFIGQKKIPWENSQRITRLDVKNCLNHLSFNKKTAFFIQL
jgi:hypothetical protein